MTSRGRKAVLAASAALCALAAATPAGAVSAGCVEVAGEDPCAGIRPGGALVYDTIALPWTGNFDPPKEGMRTVGCTIGFLVTDGARVYATTAGHCTEGYGGVGGRARTLGPAGEFGTVVFSQCVPMPGCDVGYDFGLIQLDKDKVDLADPRVLGWAAPERIFTDARQGDHTVRHFGWGWGVGSGPYTVDGDGILVSPNNPATQRRQGAMLQADQNLLIAADPYVMAASGGAIGNAPWDRFAVVRVAISPADSGSPVLALDDPLAPTDQSSGTQALGMFGRILPSGALSVERVDAGLESAGQELHRRFRLWRG